MSTHIGGAWRAAGLLPIAMAVQCTGSIAPGPSRIRDFRHRLLTELGLWDSGGPARVDSPRGRRPLPNVSPSIRQQLA